MQEVRVQRKPLVIGICAYEVVIVLFAAAAHLLTLIIESLPHVRHHVTPQIHGQTYMQIYHWVTVLSAVFALVAAFTLWHMRRSAFYLLATRAAITLVYYVIGLFTMPKLLALENSRLHLIISPLVIVVIVSFNSFCIVSLNAAIAIYAYFITKPASLQPVEISSEFVAPTSYPPSQSQ